MVKITMTKNEQAPQTAVKAEFLAMVADKSFTVESIELKSVTSNRVNVVIKGYGKP